MGASTSNFSVSKIVQNTVTDIIMSNSAVCNQSTSNTQTISFSDLILNNCEVDFNGIHQDMRLTTNFLCDQSNINNVELQNILESTLKKNLDAAANAGLGIAVSSNVSSSSAISEITNTINMTNITNCTTSAIQNQLQEYKKLTITCPPDHPKVAFKDITQNIVSNVVSTCLASNDETTKAINALQTKIDETVKSSATGLFGGDMFAGIIGIIIIIFVIGVMGRMLMNSQGSSQSYEPPPYYEPQSYSEPQYMDYQQPSQFSNYNPYQSLQPSIPPLPPAVNLNIQPVVPTNGQDPNRPN